LPSTPLDAEALDVALRVSESRYRRLFEAAQDGILLLNADTAQIEDVNPYLIDMLGYSHEEFLGKKLWEVGAFSDRAESKEMFVKLQSTGYVRYEDLPLKSKTGEIIDVEFVSNSYNCEGTKVIQCNIRNISERKTAEAKLHRHTQLYSALNQGNDDMMRCANEEELFQTICRTAVQFGGIKMAWVGLIDSETRLLQTAACYGDDTQTLKNLHISIDADGPSGHSSTSKAIQNDCVEFGAEILYDRSITPLVQIAREANLGVSASLPLRKNGAVIGAFTMFSSEIDTFDDSLRGLLAAMVVNLSFAIGNFAFKLEGEQTRDELEFRNTILKTQQETSLDAILVIDEAGKIISHNQRFLTIWQLLPSIMHAGLEAPVLQAAAEQIENPIEFVERIQYLKEHRDEKSHEEIQFRDGRVIDRYSAPAVGADGHYYGRVWYFRDVTKRKFSENRIAFLTRVYAMLSGVNALIVRVKGRDELFNEACRIAVETSGFHMSLVVYLEPGTKKVVSIASRGKHEELLAQIKDCFLTSTDASDTGTLIGMVFQQGQPIVSNDSVNDSRLLFREEYAEAGIRSLVVLPLIVLSETVGTITLYSNEINFFQQEELKLLTELAGNISFAIDHLEKQDRIIYVAHYDALTGLANRNLFLERVTQSIHSAVSNGYKLAIFLIDLERFKNVSDTLGWLAGDELLRQVAQWLKREAGNDDLVARVEADHFVVMMPKVRPNTNLASSVEKSMEAFMMHPFHLNGTVLRVAAKVGVALFPDDGADAGTLFRNAGVALKKAKANSDRYLLYTPDMTEVIAGKLTLENQLREAIINDEFVLLYQPKVNLLSGEVTGVEALIRWNNPRTGVVPPYKFISTLEETGMINEVGRWVLRQATADYLRWRAAGLEVVRIAVNVSPLQLRNPGFIQEIENIIRLDAQAAAGLELEITESSIMADVNHSIASLQAIRAMGITIAIDDFGSGFSSLSHLAKLPLDTLKIDRSFVLDMTARPEGLGLVSTIINLAHSLKLKVVAEGVETEEQSRLLRLLNCDEMQGYFFSKPVSAEIFGSKFLTATAGNGVTDEL